MKERRALALDLGTHGFLRELRQLVEHRVRTVDSGEYIGAMSDEAEHCLILFSGTVEERHTARSGRYTVSRVYQCGHVILPPNSGPKSWDQISRVAITACEIGEARMDRFWHCLSNHAVLMKYYLGRCIHDLDHIMLRLVDTNLTSVRERLRRELLRRLDLQDEGQATINIRSHDEFAAYLGANRETLSREIARFSRLGAIETSRGQIIVRDASLLKSMY